MTCGGCRRTLFLDEARGTRCWICVQVAQERIGYLFRLGDLAWRPKWVLKR